MLGRRTCLKAWPVLAISLIEIILLLAHWFLFHTWIEFWNHPSPTLVLAMRMRCWCWRSVLSSRRCSSFSFSNPVVAFIYKVAAVWLGFLNFFFWAACLSWLAWYAWLARFGGWVRRKPCRGAALIAGIAPFSSAARRRGLRPRQRAPDSGPPRSARLPGLPAELARTQGRHDQRPAPGQRQRPGFSRRIVALASPSAAGYRLHPRRPLRRDQGRSRRLLAPFKQLTPPFGVYFSTGNHEEFAGPSSILELSPAPAFAC